MLTNAFTFVSLILRKLCLILINSFSNSDLILVVSPSTPCSQLSFGKPFAIPGTFGLCMLPPSLPWHNPRSALIIHVNNQKECGENTPYLSNLHLTQISTDPWHTCTWSTCTCKSISHYRGLLGYIHEYVHVTNYSSSSLMCVLLRSLTVYLNNWNNDDLVSTGCDIFTANCILLM